VRITWEGTHTGPLATPDGGEIPATGRKVTIHACEVYRIEGGKVAEACHFFDMLGMLEQLGVMSGEAATTAPPSARPREPVRARPRRSP
jgi:hypothetical protein